MKIYTKTGDAGQTGLWGGARVPKTHPRVCAYGDVDELNCELGSVLAALASSPELAPARQALERVQAELFIVGTLLATPVEGLSKLAPPFDAGLPDDAAKRLEAEIDVWTAELPELHQFILPGGGPAGAALHVARAVCRRAERRVVALAGSDAVPAGVIIYLNRLSDHLFTAARWVNFRQKRVETAWQGLAKKK